MICELMRETEMANHPPGSARPTSRPATTSARCRHSSSPPTSGRRSTRTWPRSTTTPRRSSTTSSRRLVTSERHPTSYSPNIEGAHSLIAIKCADMCMRLASLLRPESTARGQTCRSRKGQRQRFLVTGRSEGSWAMRSCAPPCVGIASVCRREAPL